jgi:hypothetical protein
MDVREMIVYNVVTDDFVSWMLDPTGEIIITSSDPVDTEDNCVVTTWNNLAQLRYKIGRGKRNANH